MFRNVSCAIKSRHFHKSAKSRVGQPDFGVMCDSDSGDGSPPLAGSTGPPRAVGPRPPGVTIVVAEGSVSCTARISEQEKRPLTYVRPQTAGGPAKLRAHSILAAPGNRKQRGRTLSSRRTLPTENEPTATPSPRVFRFALANVGLGYEARRIDGEEVIIHFGERAPLIAKASNFLTRESS